MGYLRETRHYLDDGNVHNLSNLGGGGAHPHLQPTELHTLLMFLVYTKTWIAFVAMLFSDSSELFLGQFGYCCSVASQDFSSRTEHKLERWQGRLPFITIPCHVGGEQPGSCDHLGTSDQHPKS